MIEFEFTHNHLDALTFFAKKVRQRRLNSFLNKPTNNGYCLIWKTAEARAGRTRYSVRSKRTRFPANFPCKFSIWSISQNRRMINCKDCTTSNWTKAKSNKNSSKRRQRHSKGTDRQPEASVWWNWNYLMDNAKSRPWSTDRFRVWAPNWRPAPRCCLVGLCDAWTMYFC